MERREREIRRHLFTPSIKRAFRQIHVVVVQEQRKCTKKRAARGKLLFLLKKTYCFFDVPVLAAVAIDVAYVVAKAGKRLHPFFENFEFSKVPDNSMLLLYLFHYRFILR